MAEAGRRLVGVVDDDADIRMISELALRRVGKLDVWLAASAAEAKARLEDPGTRLPDALLLDVTMPGEDGPTFLSALRADPRFAALPVVFLTARAGTRAEEARLLDLGAQGVLSKPFDPMNLARELGALLGW